ncbi:MAG: MG2 domain-containing protein [Bacteroidia bacterium]
MVHQKITSGKWLLLLIAPLFFSTCSKKAPEKVEIDPAYGEFISGYTSGVISSNGTIRVRMAEPVADPSQFNEPLKDNPFSFDPGIKGEAYWLDDFTLEFKPAAPLPSGEEYLAKLKLGDLIEVPEEYKLFSFNFSVLQQSLEVRIDQLQAYSNTELTKQRLIGRVLTADMAGEDAIEKVLSASQNGKDLPLNWLHNENTTTHDFVVEEINRGEKASEVKLTWKGTPLNVDEDGELVYSIPALGDFFVMDVRVVPHPEQHVIIQFSDPLLADQDLEGLVTLTGTANPRTLVNGNQLLLYPGIRLKGDQTVKIAQGVKNVLNYKLKEAKEWNVHFEEMKPSVELVGNGTIMPNSGGLFLHFRAVSLKTVDVMVLKIYENNIPQFLQVNDLPGDYQMSRVGKTVLQKQVSLENMNPADLGRWATYSLDLSKLIQTEPGAIYRVRIGFRKDYSTYDCENGTAETTDDDEDYYEGDYYYEEDGMTPVGGNSWNHDDDFWNYYDQYYSRGYRYNQRDNPCHESYYGARRVVTRNVLASDLGIMAKSGEDSKLLVFVNDIKSTQPLGGIQLDLYDYQQQVIDQAETGADGIAVFQASETPFLVVARKGSQRGYLRLVDGGSLQLSQFDVSGEKVEKGLKGFIYGERGVWRPGDSLYLTFILEDTEEKVPDNYPVIMELYDPQNQLVTKNVNTHGSSGFYAFRMATPATARTGNYQARIKLGNVVFNKSLKIETVKPNRLKVKLDFGTEALVRGESNSGMLQINWLHGAAGRNLKADIQVSYSTGKTNFSKFPTFRFDDPMRTFNTESNQIFDGQVGENGHTSFSFKPEAGHNAPGMLNAKFLTKAYEPGGDFSTNTMTIPYHPFKSYTGIKMPPADRSRGTYLTDTNHLVKLVAVDSDGQPLANKELKIQLYELRWRWWWDRYDNQGNYNSRVYENERQTASVTTNSRGEASWILRVDNPLWGRFLVRACDPESGHCAGDVIYFDWPGWVSRQRQNTPGGASMLAFSTDKEKYNVGEKAVLTIPSSAGGRALVSLESGKSVVETHWVETQQGETRFSFEVTEKMAPNIFAHVTMLQPHAQSINDLPIRMYGIMPLLVEDPNSHLEPTIRMPDVLRPEKPFQVNVSEATGRPMTYTLAMVDEGLLDLTNFKTPQPWDHFYAREALGVKTWDIYDQVMGAFSGRMDKLLAIGGDGEIVKKDDGKELNRFKPVVKYIGPFHLKKGETQTHTLDMPQYVGSVKVMVIAGFEEAYGSADKVVPVRAPLMVLGTLPRVLGPDEMVKLPVSVFAMESQVKNVQVEITTNDMLTIEDGSSRSLSFSKTGDELVTFSLKVKPLTGVAKVKIKARSGRETAEQEITLEIRNPNPEVTNVFDTVLEAGAAWNINYAPVGMAGTNYGVLELSSIPPLNLDERLEFLIRYPYGCIEQTTSSVFPQLFVEHLMDLPPAEKAQIKANVAAGIARLSGFQVSGGGFAYWPGQRNVDDWSSSYAGHFLVEAKNLGYSVPENMLSRWKNYQTNIANSWVAGGGDYGYRSDFVQAYRLYTLALAKSPALGAMNRLRERSELTPTARWRLAAAYQLSGKPDVAKQLVRELPLRVEAYRELSYTYGSGTRDEAMILETLTLMGEKTKGAELLKHVSGELSSNRWMSTQTTAYTLMATSKFLGNSTLPTKMDYTYSLNGGSKTNAASNTPLNQVPLSIKGTQGGNVSLKNNSDGILFARVILHGIPITGDQTSADNALKIDVNYKLPDGTLLDPQFLDQGTDFVAEVTIFNPGYRGHYQEMALTQIFPSGWEIINTRLLDFDSGSKEDKAEYLDIRDDRVYTFFDLSRNDSKTFRVMLNASYLGRYYLPTVSCEAMYDETINSRRPGQWVEVVKAGDARMN